MSNFVVKTKSVVSWQRINLWEETAYHMIFEFLILASIKLNIIALNLFYALVEKVGQFLCMSGDEWGRKYILDGWGWMDILYGFGGGRCRWMEVFWLGRGVRTFSMGGEGITNLSIKWSQNTARYPLKIRVLILTKLILITLSKSIIMIKDAQHAVLPSTHAEIITLMVVKCLMNTLGYFFVFQHWLANFLELIYKTWQVLHKKHKKYLPNFCPYRNQVCTGICLLLKFVKKRK